jgi:endonuclease/exonuclease/phosphatase family metal-dependent hydrolase
MQPITSTPSKAPSAFLTALLLSATVALAAPADLNPPLKVMSFNLRYATANDGTNSWPHRHSLVRETIQVSDPDLLGLQEVLQSQVDYLRQHFPNYGFHGVGRDDGRTGGEYVPLMWKRDRFDWQDAGHFWLSETPEVPGSVSWDSSLTRMVSWVALRDRHGDDRTLIVVNTHWDHRGAAARRESARLIRQRMETDAAAYPIILMGDFNTNEDGEPYAILVHAQGFTGRKLTDTHRVIHPERSPNEATYNGWRATRKGSRIDWILHSPEFTTLNAGINYMQENGRYPSDHYPVEAVLRLVR